MHAINGKKGEGQEPRERRPVDSLSAEEQEALAQQCVPNFPAQIKQSLQLLLADPDIQLTRVIKSKGSVTKIVYPGPNGERLSDPSQCWIARGIMERLKLGNWRHFARIVEKTPHNVAFALGCMRPGLPDSIRIVSRKDPLSKTDEFATRTQENIIFEKGLPSLILLDIDTKGMPPEVREHIKELSGILGALESLCPEITRSGYVRRESTSAGIFNKETGEDYPSSGGEHIYLLVRDASDARRFLYALHDLAWLAGLGWYIVGKAGRLLERAIIDRSVCDASRLVFEADATCEPPFGQHKRAATVNDGLPYDTRSKLNDLSPSELKSLKRVRADVGSALDVECKDAREAWIAERIEKSVAGGMTPETARRLMTKLLDNSVLHPSMLLTFDNPDIGEITVGDVLTDPSRFDNETLADPIDGISYGPHKGKVYVRENGDVTIHSCAHGLSVLYHLRHGYLSIATAIEKAAKEDVATVLCRLIIFADLNDIEEGDLIKLAADRCGEGKRRTVAKMVKEACSTKRKADSKARREKERADRQDERPEIFLSDDLTIDLPVCESALINADGIEIYQRGGFIVRCGLTPRKTHDGKTVNDKMIVQHSRESLRIVLADAATFAKRNPATMMVTGVYPPDEIAGMLLKHPIKNYPVLRGVISVPTLRGDGTILITPGYDTETGLYFDNDGVDFGLIPENPTQEDARAALEELQELIKLFPFVDEASRSVAIGRILTGVVRATLKNAPLFAYSAPAPRTGKSKLNDIGSMIEKGHEAPVISASENPEEFEKQLTSSIMDGSTLIALDNIEGELRSPLLCQMLTQDIVRVRLFGQNEKMFDFPSVALIVANGNQLIITKDLTERTLLCRLDAGVELPGARVFSFDPVEYVRKDRPRYVRAVLTILRAYAVSGYAVSGSVTSMGGFDDWSKKVRGALIWLGLPDPCETMTYVRSQDPTKEHLAEIMERWEEVFHSVNSIKDVAGSDLGKTVAEVISRAYGMGADKKDDKGGIIEEGDRRLLNALQAVSRDGRLSANGLGQWFEKNKDKVLDGKHFYIPPKTGAAKGTNRIYLIAPQHKIDDPEKPF